MSRLHRFHVPSATSLVLALAFAGCGSGSSSDGDGDTGGSDAGTIDGAANSDAGPQVCAPPSNQSRGLQWVRENPMFTSGLAVLAGSPDASQLDDYFNDFGASAAHLWVDGLPTVADAWRAEGHPFVAWTQNDGTAQNGQVLGGYDSNTSGRIGYQVGDEPRTMAALLELEAGIEAVRAVDPEALAFVNFTYLADEIENMLDYYRDTIGGDIVSYDRYSRSSSRYETMALFREAGLAQGVPYWAYLRSYRGPGEDDSSPTDMRWDVYSHLLFGYTGLTWFVYQILDANDPAIEGPSLFATVGDLAVPKATPFAVASSLNGELKNIGRVMTQLRSTDVRYIPFTDLAQPDGTTNWSAEAGGDPYLASVEMAGDLSEVALGFFEDDCGDHYLMVQNPNHTGGSFPVDNDNELAVTLGFDFAAAPANLRSDSLQAFNNETGATESLAIANGELVVTLAAGAAVLLKYDNGRGFQALP